MSGSGRFGDDGPAHPGGAGRDGSGANQGAIGHDGPANHPGAQAGGTNRSAADDATRIKPAPGGDATRIKPAADGDAAPQAFADDERTRLKPAADVARAAAPAPAEDGSTRIRPAPAAAGGTTGGTARSTTGSDWSHPERWVGGDTVELGPGSVIKERFVLESVLGQGGMGVVYRALDRRKEEAQDREPYVAIKILGEDFRRHPQALIALQREARKAQTLAHPNVITVHDFDRDGTTVFMTMELLDGDPLNRVIADARRGLPRDKALGIVSGMAAALTYAHEKGIVHSDFKPGNVFLTRRGHVKVLDFGIARAVPNALQGDGDRTVFDAAELGALTLPYASPEMIRGEAPVPADDVFALGIVAYELLTGRHPFDRESADNAREEGMKPPAVPGLPRRQRAALARALAFERDARQPDAGAFLKELEGPSPARKAAYAGALVVLAAVAGYSFYASNELRPDVPWSDLPEETKLAFDEAVAEGERALVLGDFALNDAFAYFDQAYSLHRNNPTAIAGLESVADRFLDASSAADAADRRNVIRKLYCQEYLSSYDPVRSACQRLGEGQCSRASLGCTNADPQR